MKKLFLLYSFLLFTTSLYSNRCVKANYINYSMIIPDTTLTHESFLEIYNPNIGQFYYEYQNSKIYYNTGITDDSYLPNIYYIQEVYTPIPFSSNCKCPAGQAFNASGICAAPVCEPILGTEALPSLTESQCVGSYEGLTTTYVELTFQQCDSTCYGIPTSVKSCNQLLLSASNSCVSPDVLEFSCTDTLVNGLNEGLTTNSFCHAPYLSCQELLATDLISCPAPDILDFECKDEQVINGIQGNLQVSNCHAPYTTCTAVLTNFTDTCKLNGVNSIVTGDCYGDCYGDSLGNYAYNTLKCLDISTLGNDGNYSASINQANTPPVDSSLSGSSVGTGTSKETTTNPDGTITSKSTIQDIDFSPISDRLNKLITDNNKNSNSNHVDNLSLSKSIKELKSSSSLDLSKLGTLLTKANKNLGDVEGAVNGLKGPISSIDNGITSIVDSMSNEGDSASVLDTIIQNFIDFKDNIVSQYDVVIGQVDGLESTLDTGLVNNLPITTVSACPYNNSIDFGSVSIPIEIDICKVLAPIYPATYFLFYVMFFSSFLSLSFSLFLSTKE